MYIETIGGIQNYVYTYVVPNHIRGRLDSSFANTLCEALSAFYQNSSYVSKARLQVRILGDGKSVISVRLENANGSVNDFQGTVQVILTRLFGEMNSKITEA